MFIISLFDCVLYNNQDLYRLNITVVIIFVLYVQDAQKNLKINYAWFMYFKQGTDHSKITSNWFNWKYLRSNRRTKYISSNVLKDQMKIGIP